MDHEPGPYTGLELLATAVLLLADDLVVGYANPAAENLFELSRRQLVGHSARSTFGDAPALFNAIDKALATGASYTEQELELGINGKPRLHLSCTVSVVDAGDATLLLEFRHIDQQLKIAREERLLEQQQANRELIRSLAHEIKNPLGGIRGAAQLLERELDRPPLIEYTQVIIGEADRLQTLVNRLLTPHRLPTYRRTNIHEILARVATVVQAEFPDVAIQSDFDISLPEFEADPEQLHRQCSTRGPECRASATGYRRPDDRIKTRVARSVTLAKPLSARARRLRRGQRAGRSRNDPRQDLLSARVGTRGGSGLGLTIAQTFIAQHNGTIECESVPGCTVFTILLPLEFNRPGA
jgi:two-component system nitrogen regulation sensor histidine kinase GlnL